MLAAAALVLVVTRPRPKTPTASAVAILCPEPFPLCDVVPAQGLARAGPTLPERCLRREVVLHKAL